MNRIRKREKSPALFDLIKSLTGQEKRYFSLFSKRHIIGNGNDYKRLFDCINNQEVYDEAQVIKLLPNKKFTKHIDRHKNYLYKLILKSLRVFHSSKTLSIDMREQLDHIELLIYKNQWSQCEKYIDQAKYFATVNDLFTGYVDIMALEMDLMQAKSDRKWLENNIDNIRNKENEIIAKQTNFFQYRRLNNILKILASKYGISDVANHIETYNEVFNSPLLKKVGAALSDKAIVRYYHLNGQRFYFTGDCKKSFFHYDSLIKFIEANSSRLQQHSKSYIAAIHNCIDILQRGNSFDNVVKYINRLKKMPINIELSKEYIHVRYYEQMLRTCIRFWKFEEGDACIKEAELWLKQTDVEQVEKIRLIELYYNLSYLYYASGEYKRSLKFANLIQTKFNWEINSELGYYARILTILSHFDLGNEDICLSLIRSIIRNKQKSKTGNKIEYMILSFIYNKYFRLNSDTERILFFGELKQRILKLIDSPNEAKALEYFDFVSWLESKIQKRSFADVVMAKTR